jgi:hypothetical protein
MDLLQSNSMAVSGRRDNPLSLLMRKQDKENYSGGGRITTGNRHTAEIIYSDNPCDGCQWSDDTVKDIPEVLDYCHYHCKL